MDRMGIDLTGLTHVGNVITPQTLMQPKPVILVDLLSVPGGPEGSVSGALQNLVQWLVSSKYAYPLPDPSDSGTGMFSSSHRALLDLPRQLRRLTIEVGDITREVRSFHLEQQRFAYLIDRLSRAVCLGKSEASVGCTSPVRGDGHSGYGRGGRGHHGDRDHRRHYY